jgi:hypothetical protein
MTLLQAINKTQLLSLCVQMTRSVVTIEGTLSSYLKNKTGMKQGDYHQY